MKVLITGANGFIGRHWVEQLLRLGLTVVATGRGADRQHLSRLAPYRALDITDPHSIRSVFDAERPDAVLHAAAISKPDECALDPARADRVNVDATRELLMASAVRGCSFCFLSTDFVFDGERGMYTESDIPSPVNHYGQTKWLAEQLVAEYPHIWSIVRTVSVYGQPVAGRANLLSIVAEKLRGGETYSVVDDQIRTPTYAGDLAWGVGRLIQGGHTGTFHLSGEDVLTPYAMAVRTATYLGLDPAGIRRVTAESFQQPARRPPRTGFIIEKARQAIGFRPLSFAEGLALSFPRN